MKSLVISIVVFLGLAIAAPKVSNAQGCCDKGKMSCNKSCEHDKTMKNTAGVSKDSLKVSGACSMCKARIEKAAKNIKGVTSATWNSTSKMLVYSYNGTIKKADVSNAMLAVGHDTQLGKAPDKVYQQLPACCKYRN